MKYPAPNYGFSDTGAPVLYEAPHARAEAIDAEVIAPAGFLHVGWFCEHKLHKTEDGEWTREPHHQSETRKNKRGYKIDKNVSKSLSFGDHDYHPCPQATPMFIRETTK